MPIIRPVRGFTPKFGNNCFIADNATIIGDFVCGDDCSFWFNSVVRGDVNSIIIGNKVNVQDGAIIHCTYEKTKTIIGNNVSIGHNAIVHGCTIEDNVLVGMGAIIMDDALVESNVLIAAGAVVLEKSYLESGFIYGGVPAKRIKALTKENFQHYIGRIANNYVLYASWFGAEWQDGQILEDGRFTFNSDKNLHVKVTYQDLVEDVVIDYKYIQSKK